MNNNRKSFRQHGAGTLSAEDAMLPVLDITN